MKTSIWKLITSPLKLIRGIVILTYMWATVILMATLSYLWYFITILLPSKKLVQKIRLPVLYKMYLLSCILLKLALNRLTDVSEHLPTSATLSNSDSYIIICNHQSWIDILIVCIFACTRTPLSRFLMKRELLWQLPFASWYCYMTGSPFLTRKKTNKKPPLDTKQIKLACKHLTNQPSTFIIFPEGTRFSHAKHKKTRSPYRHLLSPKAGGLSTIIEALQPQIKYIINNTIIYKTQRPSLINLFLGNIPKIDFYYEAISINKKIINEDQTNTSLKNKTQSWLNATWQKKDAFIDKAIQL